MTLPNSSILLGNRYRLGEQLGIGGMGAVFRAADRLSGQQVALKRVSIGDDSTLLGSLSAGSSLDFRLALAQEFKTLAGLRHPHIIHVLDYGFDSEKQPYFTMSLLEKPQSLVAYGKTQPLHEQVRLLIELLQALAYLHRQRILHRDLKPANVLVTDGVVKVVDFGLALVREARGQHDERLVGTVAYIAPELLNGQPPSEASDLYAVGIMMYEIFAGRHPFTLHDTSTLIINILNSRPDLTLLNFSTSSPVVGEAPPLVIDPALMNARMVDVVQKLLSKDMVGRYHDASAVIADLSAALGQPISVEPISIRESFLQAAQFVGREADLAPLENAMAEMLAGRGSAWLIGGESGVGKSRLLDELGNRALVSNVLVLRGQSTSDAKLPYQPWRDVLRRLALAAELDDLEASILKAIIPDLELLLGRPLPEAPPLEGAAWQQRLMLTIADVFRKCRSPILLLIEDLQWAEESLEPLKFLIWLAGERPLLIVGSYRDDERPDLPAALPGMQLIPLKRLSTASIAELSAAMLGRAGRQSALLDLLQRETEGNAFFLVEVVRVLAEQAGGLSRVGALAVPDKVFAAGVHTLIQRRLARIPSEAHPLLKVAAVAGRQIDLALLSKADLQGTNLDQWLTSCVNAALLDRQNGRYQFAHDKLREALLADLMPEEQPMLHRRVAEAVESVYAGSQEHAAVLAEHWQRAGDSAKARVYAVLAGRQALAVSNFRGALALAERALSAATPQSMETIPLLNLIGESYWGLSNYPQARAAFKDALASAREHGDELGLARALKGLGDVAWRQSDYSGAQGYYEESLTRYRMLNSAQEIAEALQGLAWVAVHQGQYAAARRHFEDSLERSRALGSIRGISEALRGLGESAIQQRDYSAARVHFAEALKLAESVGDRRGMAGMYRGLGEVTEYLGDLTASRSYFENFLALNRVIGDPRGIAMALYGLGSVAIEQTDYLMAQAYHEEGLTVCRSIGARRGVSTNLCSLAYIQLRLGIQDAARRFLHEALSGGRDSNDLPVLLNALAVYAFLYEAEGQPERAAQVASLVMNRPETPSYAIKLLEPLRANLESFLPPGALTDALETGRRLELEDAIAAVLAENS